MLSFNKPFISGNEINYIQEVLNSGSLSGNGKFTKKCQKFFEDRYHFKKCFLTSSCTDALEMISLLINIEPGDEVIIPSYTFVSTANAFYIKNAKIIFADSKKENPNIDPHEIKKLITKKTKAIVVVHYAGIACDMDAILEIAAGQGIYVIEDAAHGIDSYYKKQPLGSIGHLGTLSFHETKNICSGEGGLLIINDERFLQRAEIISEKGTNRTAFFKGEIDKYGWVDAGSSFYPSEIIAAFLFAQLENLEKIQKKRKIIWEMYRNGLNKLHDSGKIFIPHLENCTTNNAHMFYFLCCDKEARKELLYYLKSNNIQATFHYQALHCSEFYISKFGSISLPNAEHYSEVLIRLPMYFELEFHQVEYVIKKIHDFYNKN